MSKVPPVLITALPVHGAHARPRKWEVHIAGEFGTDGMTSSTELVEFNTEAEAWDFVKGYYQDHGFDEILLVRKPEISNSSLGYPTQWAEEPAGFYSEICK